MRNVVYALLPVALFAVWLFGISALASIIVSVAACIGTEHLFCKLSDRPSSVNDWSVTITGLLLALTLPPCFPLWMVAVGAFISVAIGKMAFGGLGFNIFNPALVGRAFLQASFPVAITTYSKPLLENRFFEFIPTSLTFPFTQPVSMMDAITSATPLMQQKFDRITTDVTSLFLGTISGSAGETSSLLILIGGLYLIARGFADWRIPTAMLGTACLAGAAFHLADPTRYPDPLFVLFSGGLMLGALFMATDMVGSPVTPLGVWIYGALMGLLTVIIRATGGLPEGVMYAILLGNALSPIIDNMTQPRIFGAQKKEAKS